MNIPYNNIAISALALQATVQEAKELPISKLYLILPIILNKGLLKTFSATKCKIYGIEYVIVSQAKHFLNFNDRYYAFAPLSTNALQMLLESGYIALDDLGNCKSAKALPYNSKMGTRAKQIYAAAGNVADFLMHEKASNLYLNLRIEL